VKAARDEVNHTVEERFSLGFLLQEDGAVVDVVRDSPAWKAGLGPGMKLLTVDQQQWSPQVLRNSIAADHNSSAPIGVSVRNGPVNFTTAIEDHSGLSYPRLEQNANSDLMSEILRPRIAAGATP